MSPQVLADHMALVIWDHHLGTPRPRRLTQSRASRSRSPWVTTGCSSHQVIYSLSSLCTVSLTACETKIPKIISTDNDYPRRSSSLTSASRASRSRRRSGWESLSSVHVKARFRQNRDEDAVVCVDLQYYRFYGDAIFSFPDHVQGNRVFRFVKITFC